MGDIPTVDLSAFLKDGEEEGKKLGNEIISRACTDYGFFQAVNHGVLMSRAMEQSKAFFSLPDEVKLQYRPRADAPVPAGYGKQPPHATDKSEFVMDSWCYLQTTASTFCQTILLNSEAWWKNCWDT